MSLAKAYAEGAHIQRLSEDRAKAARAAKTEQPTTETVRLTGWMSFEDGATSIRALLFGALVDRAILVVQHYRSDLFHDALWIDEFVTGPTTFDYVVRESGTNLGESAKVWVSISAGDAAKFYRVELVEDGGLWSAVFTDVPLSQVAALT